MIPKIIWQTHEWEYEDLPHDYKMASLTWVNLNKDWDYRYVSKRDRERYIGEYDSDLLRFYNSCDGITQSDIWRYVALYLHGGVYVDMDTHAVGKLNEVIAKFDESKDFFCMPEFYLDGKKKVVTGTHAAPKGSATSNALVKDICLAKDKKALLTDWVFEDGEEKLNIGWNIISDCVLKYEDRIGFNFTNQVVKHYPAHKAFEYDSELWVFFDNNWFLYEDLVKIK